MDTTKPITKVMYGNTEIPLKTLNLQEKTVAPSTSSQVVEPDVAYGGLSKVNVDAIRTETKTVKSTTSSQTVAPTAGSFISEVTVQPIELQEKSVNPSTVSQEVVPDVGKDGLSRVNVAAVQTEEKTPTIDFTSVTEVEVTPTSGKYLTKVTVERPEDLVSANIRTGKTLFGIAGNLEPDKPDQSKTVTPTTTAQVVEPDTGYELASVTVNAIETEQRTVKSITTSQTITPTSGKFIDEVTVNPIVLQSKTATPTTSQQTITPDSGNDGLASVTVNAIPSNYKDTTNTNAVAGDVLAGKVAVNSTGEITGTIQTYSGSSSVTSNQTLATAGKYVASDIVINVPSSTPTLVTKNITQNGTYNASSDNADGYSSVTVDVSGGGNSSTIVSARTKLKCVEPVSWSLITWEGLTNFNGDNIWTDGTNIYYSSGSTQYVLNIATSTWTTKTWNGLTSFDGRHIWTDGTNIYYSSDSTQYVLDVATSTWTTKTWSGLTSFYGIRIWTDGINIYYSKDSDQYVLDVSTSIWSAKTWSGLTSFTKDAIWTDGINIYYSRQNEQYVLNIATSTWTTKTWSGLTTLFAGYIWTDGANIYYSSSSTQYVLNVAKSTWTTKTWSGFTNINGSYIWTDGTNIYYSYNGTNRKLNGIQAPNYSVQTSPILIAQYTSDNPLTATTDAEMTALLVSANDGKVVKFIGTSSTYDTDAYYVIEEDS